MGATFSRIKNWINGEILTASDLNGEFNNILDNLNPAGVDDTSSTTTAMRTMVDPLPAGSPSLPTSLEGELHRIRYQLDQVIGKDYWYDDPSTNLESVGVGGSRRRSVTFIVAASDSVDPTSADYQCDGTNDEVEIQAAIDALPDTGGTIVFLEGNYKIAATIEADAKISMHLEGSGSGGWGKGTVFHLVANTTMWKFTNTCRGNVISNLTFHGHDAADSDFTGYSTLSKGNKIIFLENPTSTPCHNMHFINLGFRCCSPAMYIEDGWDYYFERCNFQECGYQTDTDKAAIVFYGTGLQSINAAIRFNMCRFEPRTGYSMYFYPEDQSVTWADVGIVNCKFEASALGYYPAIYGRLFASRIIGNYFYHTATDYPAIVILSESDFISIADNTFLGSHTEHAMHLSCRMSSIHGNTFYTGTSISGTASAGGSSTLTDSSKTWTTNQFVDGLHEEYVLTLTGGTGVGQSYPIASNNATTITVTGTFNPVPSTDTTYVVSKAPIYLTSDAYHTLISNNACYSDGDTYVQSPLIYPNDGNYCSTYFNKGVQNHVKTASSNTCNRKIPIYYEGETIYLLASTSST